MTAFVSLLERQPEYLRRSLELDLAALVRDYTRPTISPDRIRSLLVSILTGEPVPDCTPARPTPTGATP